MKRKSADDMAVVVDDLIKMAADNAEAIRNIEDKLQMHELATSYWFEKLKLLLTVYVDDLMLSGPKGNHEVFWAELSKRVGLDEPEALNRFLGRTHVVDT